MHYSCMIFILCKFLLGDGTDRPIAPSPARFVAWKTRGVDFFQLCRIDMRINLGRRDVRMPQHRLHGTQVGAPLQEMRGKRMAQHVR